MLQPVISHQTVRLARGQHSTPRDGVCVMELASMLGHERFTDRPRCACPVIGAFLRGYNDAVDDRTRQTLFPYAAAVVGTAGDDAARTRRLERLVEELHTVRGRRLVGRRRMPLRLPVLDGELDRAAADLARALWRQRKHGGHERALKLADDLLAMGCTRAIAEGSTDGRASRDTVTAGVA
jgi:hypothetical protein